MTHIPEIELDGKSRWTLIAVTAFVLTAALVWLWRGGAFGSEADELFENGKAHGYPATLEELDAWYEPVPPAENAAIEYIRAQSYVPPDLPTDFIPVPPPDEPMSVEQYERLQGLLAAGADAIRILHEAAKLPRARYPVDLTELFRRSPQYAMQQCSLVSLLKAEALIAAEDGRGDDAMDALLAIMALTRSHEREPTIEASVQRFAFNAEAFDVIGRVMSRGRPSDEKLLAFAAAARRSARREPVERAYAGNRLIEYHLLLANAQRQSAQNAPPVIAELFGAAYVGDHTLQVVEPHERFLSVMRELPPHEMLDACREFKEAGTCYGLLLSYVQHVARVRLVETAVAVELHRRAHGLPETLADLADEDVPTIPITGKRPRYEPDGRGFSVSCRRLEPRNDRRGPLKVTVTPVASNTLAVSP